MRPSRVALFSAVLFVSLPLAGQAAPDDVAVSPAPTTSQQADSKSDATLTRKIRRSIVADKSLSTHAHTVEIITREGMVTLRGRVASEREKRLVQQSASDVVGLRRVKSELEVRL